MKTNSKDKPKQKAMNEAQLLDLLKKVLPKATDDAKLAGRIYQAIEQELKHTSRVKAFEKFCAKVELPDLEPTTILQVKEQLAASFGDGDVTIKPNKKDQSLAIEVSLPDGQFQSEIKVKALSADASDEQEITLKFVPFPVCMEGDMELVWFLAKRENMTPEDAGIMLSKIEEDFWASKTGQKLIRDRVDRCFPEFISRAPAGMLNEVGLKRHYKTPEPVKPVRTVPTGKAPGRK